MNLLTKFLEKLNICLSFVDWLAKGIKLMSGRPRLLKLSFEGIEIRARRVPVPVSGDISDAPCLKCIPLVTERQFVLDIQQHGLDCDHFATVYRCKTCGTQYYCEYTINDEEQLIDEVLFGRY